MRGEEMEVKNASGPYPKMGEERENVKVRGMCARTVSSSESARAPRVEEVVCAVMGYVEKGRVRVEVEGSDGDVGEVVSALNGALNGKRPDITIEAMKGVSVHKRGRWNKLDVRVVVKGERDGKWEVVGKVVGQVEVVPKVQVPLSAREKALKGVKVEYTSGRSRFEIRGEQLHFMHSMIDGGSARGVWITARAYACRITYEGSSAWFGAYFRADKTAQYMPVYDETQIPTTEAGVLSVLGSYTYNAGMWTGELPTGPLPWV